MATWAATDLHGCLNAWEKMKEIIGPNDKVYVLGDCIDRGPQSWEIMKICLSKPAAITLKMAKCGVIILTLIVIIMVGIRQ